MKYLSRYNDRFLIKCVFIVTNTKKTKEISKIFHGYWKLTLPAAQTLIYFFIPVAITR